MTLISVTHNTYTPSATGQFPKKQTEMEIGVQKVYWGVSVGLTAVEKAREGSRMGRERSRAALQSQ